LQKYNSSQAHQALAELEDKQHRDKLEAYYYLGLKCIEKSFEMMGIKYLYNPVEVTLKRKQDLLSVLDILKHSFSLVGFVSQFQDYLSQVYLCFKSHKVQIDRLIDDTLNKAQLLEYMDVFHCHCDQLQLLQGLTNEIQTNYYFEVIFSPSQKSTTNDENN
jgi:hypothetical protein